MKKIVLLSTDTLHHRYFINRLKEFGHDFHSIIFENSHVNAPFEVAPFFGEEENAFEQEHFFSNLSSDISSENILTVENINNQQSINHILELKADIAIVFGTRKLGKAIIESFSDGLYNIHRGIPQKYRGLDSDLWAIYHGDLVSIGATLHKVDTQLDTGEIVFQGSIMLSPSTEIFHLRYLTSKLATDFTIKLLDDYKNGNLKLIPQSKIGRYYSFMPLSIKNTLVKKFKRLVNGK